MGHRCVGVVEDGAEHGATLQPGRRVAEDQVDSLGGGGDVVGEKAEAGQSASVFHARFQELTDLRRRQGEVPGYGQPVCHVDTEIVGREDQRPLLDNRPGGVVDRGLGFERLTAPQSGHGEDRRNRAPFHQVAHGGVENCRQVEPVLLARRRGAESAAQAGAERKGIRKPVAARQLAVDRGAEILEVLDAGRRTDRPSVLHTRQFHVAVGCNVAAVPLPGRLGAVAAEAVGTGAESLSRVGADFPGLPLSQPRFILFVAPLGPGGKVEPIVDGIGDIQVEADLLLPIAAEVELGGGLGTERGVDRVADEQIGLVGPNADAPVPDQILAGESSYPGDHRAIGYRAAEVGREASREDLLEGEAIGVGHHPAHGERVGHVIGDGYRGTVGGGIAAGGCNVADEQGSTAVSSEDASPRVGVAEKETARHLLAGVAGVPVELQAIGEREAEIAEELEVAVNLRRAPDLGGVAHVGIARRQERRHVAALNAAVGRLGAAVLEAEVGETGGAQRQSGVAGYTVGGAVPSLQVATGVELQTGARTAVPGQQIDDPGNGVGAVLGGRSVAQHLGLAQGNGRDARDVGPLGSEGHAVAAVPVDDGGAVAPLPVDQDKGVVGGQVAQHHGPHDGGGVADRLGVDVEGGHHRPQLGCQVPAPLAGEVVGPNDVHRDRGLGRRSRLGSAAHHHNGGGDGAQFQREVAQHRLSGYQLDVAGGGGLEAGGLHRNRVDPGFQVQLVGAYRIGGAGHLGSRGIVGCRDFGGRDSRAIGILHVASQDSGLLSVGCNGNCHQDQSNRQDGESVEHEPLPLERIVHIKNSVLPSSRPAFLMGSPGIEDSGGLRRYTTIPAAALPGGSYEE